MLTICHVIFDTLVFSSMLFISIRDAIAVIGRYFVPVICCRVVLMYELALIRDSINVTDVSNYATELLPKGSSSNSRSSLRFDLI